MAFDVNKLLVETLCAQSGIRLDDNRSMTLLQELRAISSRVYETVYRRNVFIERDGSPGLLPVNTEGSSADESITTRRVEGAGRAVTIHPETTSVPTASGKVIEVPRKVVSIAAAYEHSLQELRASLQVGRPVNAFKAAIAQRAMEDKMDDMAAFGEPGIFPGLLNDTNVPLVTLPNAGAFAALTKDQMIANIRAMTRAVEDAMEGTHRATVLAVSPAVYNALQDTDVGTENEVTVLDYLLRNTSLERVEKVYAMTDAVSAGNDRILAFQRDPLVAEFRLPSPLETLAPQDMVFHTKYHLHARVGGTEIHQPLAMAYATVPNA